MYGGVQGGAPATPPRTSSERDFFAGFFFVAVLAGRVGAAAGFLFVAFLAAGVGAAAGFLFVAFLAAGVGAAAGFLPEAMALKKKQRSACLPQRARTTEAAAVVASIV